MPEPKIPIGWREWVALPALGIPAIKAKIDTGARTSALHAYYIELFRRNRRHLVRFGIHPLQRTARPELVCEAEVMDVRIVMDSGGHREKRIVIETNLALGGVEWPIELTLTNRESMLFRMLLGRTAMTRRVRIDPAASYLTGRVNGKTIYGLRSTKKERK